MTNKLKKEIKDFFTPPLCLVCKEAGTFLCADCKNEIDGVFGVKEVFFFGGMRFVDEAFCLFPYRNISVKKLVLTMKRNDLEGTKAVLLPYLEKAFAKIDFSDEIDEVAFCPRSKAKIRRFGVDQAKDLAFLVGEIIKKPVTQNIRRRRRTFEQHKLKKGDRRDNVSGIFTAAGDFDGKNILLVDDVVTTGCTVNEIAHELKKCGAMSVFVFSLAH